MSDKTEPAGPDLGPTGPSVENEDQILRELYGSPDENGFYTADPEGDSE